jgi:salicylate hydroxylase
VASSRTVIVAGAGIGGLTTALALAQRGFRINLLDQAARLEETGAGIQLSPNATRVLVSLGLDERLRREIVAPESVRIHSSRGHDLVQVPLGKSAADRYGAPYWTIHRGDLQKVLLEAAQAHPDIALKLGTRVEDFVVHGHGVTVACRRGTASADESGLALVAADGLWSELRRRLGNSAKPAFRHRTAWRALLPADSVAPEFREPHVHLWLGRDAHLVHYPVRMGNIVNLVAIVHDSWSGAGWSEAGPRDELLSRFPKAGWAEPARALLALPESWTKWALHDLAPIKRWGDGPVTMVGDAAHPTLPFLAQGAALAIEDAAVLAASLAQRMDDPARAMRAYEAARRERTARVQRASRSNAKVYHLAGAEAMARNLAMRMIGGERLLHRYDWLYNWRPLPGA